MPPQRLPRRRRQGRIGAGLPGRAPRWTALRIEPTAAPELLECRGQPRRREQMLEFLPPLRRVVCGAAARFDEVADHVLAEIVVDDVASILIEEPHALRGPIVR